MFNNETFGERRLYQPQRRQPIGRFLLTLWAIASLLWAGAVAYNLYHRVSTQAAMSNVVERELDQGFTQASCTGVNCSGGSEKPASTAKWSDIATTYVKFGRGQMAELLLGPPVALFLIGLGGLVFYRSRLMNSRGRFYSRFE